MNTKKSIFSNPFLLKKRIASNRFSFRDNFDLNLLILPGVLALFIFNYLPMFGIVIAFKDFNPNIGILKSDWIGFENFEFFLKAQDAWRIGRNTVLYGIAFQITGIIAALTLALMLYEVKSKFKYKLYSTIMIIPNFLSWVLVAYIAYALLSPSAGVLNRIITFFGGTNIDWYSDPKYWPSILTIANIWKFVGINSIIYYAALMGIDESLFEAARIDGANKWHEIRYIKIPEITSVVIVLLILGIGNLIRGDFGLFYQLPMDIGVLYPTTDIIDTYVYRGLQKGSMGMAAAVGLFQSVVGLILVIGSNMVVKKISPENSMF